MYGESNEGQLCSEIGVEHGMYAKLFAIKEILYEVFSFGHVSYLITEFDISVYFVSIFCHVGKQPVTWKEYCA